MKHNKKAFTLIELLVVILIIGILAAVALPQYQKAVEKARWAEWITVMNGIEREAQLAFLAQAFPANGDDDYDICKNFESFSGGSWNGGNYKTKNFEYSIQNCSAYELYIDTYRIGNGSGYLQNVEAYFYPNGGKKFIVYDSYDMHKLVYDTLVAAYGTEVVSY